MPATVTLSSTTLSQGINDRETKIKLASTAGITTDTRLYCDGELMKVVSLDIDPWVNVVRGIEGTQAQLHASAQLVWIGRGDQFYAGPPIGRPHLAIPVSPYIDVLNGKIYFAQGDSLPTGGNLIRYWQPQTVTNSTGAFGVRTVTYDPTSST